MHVLIAGYGGIASAVANQLRGEGHSVTVISRRVCDEVDQISWQQLPEWLANHQPECIINTIGCLSDNEHQPEKNIMQLDKAWLQHSLDVNVWPTVQLAQTLQPHIKRLRGLKMMVLSARVSSISDNRLGGWYSYRLSKCALNMLIKNIAIEWRRINPTSVVFGYHPGTVDTALSKPFQARVPEHQLFSPEKAARYLLACLTDRQPQDSGALFDWRGDSLQF